MTVLILAREFDPTADAVVQELTETHRVPVFRTDLADFPRRLRLEARLESGHWAGRLWNEHRSVDLEDIHAIWNRNPSNYTFDDSLTPAEQEFCYREARLGVSGVLASLDVLWANHPNRCADAIWKPYQWTIATECGLSVADTLITNNPGAARSFVGDTPRDTIVKALGPAGITEGGQSRVAFTRRLTTSDLDDPAGIAATATTLQDFIPKAFEVRVTVIGQRTFPIAIYATTDDTRTDWRSDPAALHYERVSLPDTVATGITAYMKRTDLAYAGFDFVVTPLGDWVMLEANTGPQWGWLQAATHAPIAEAMATMLAEGRK